ncbi:MAG: hypothetical protein IIY80_01330, partial [Aeriscardovia sp.]|nr:hypothetical protein [Aeriscardovia sp.]
MKDDLLRHIDFEGWQFVSKEGGAWASFDPSRPFVCFGSLQDFLGKRDGGIKDENRWAHEEDWDMVILDEYHFGAWREKSKHLFSDADVWEEDFYDEGTKRAEKGGESDKEAVEEFLNAYMPIKSERFLYLSGTPFRMLENGEFLEDQIFSWTYEDEQKAKREWSGPDPNPYASLPEMEMYTYTLPEDIAKIADKGEAGFDLNEFFRAESRGEKTYFTHKEAVQQWLNLISGKFNAAQQEILAKNNVESRLPYLPGLFPNHSLWFLPGVASCQAMKNLLQEPQNAGFASHFKIVLCAGKAGGNGIEAKKPVIEAAGPEPEKTCTITLSCGKLTTGVTVPFWSAILMLRSLNSPETYFQTAFRAQSPWIGKDGQILKEKCFIFDFSPIRVLKETAEYIAANSFDPTWLVWNTNSAGQECITLPEEQWDLVESLEYNLFYDDGNGYIDLGLDTVFDFDDNGNLLAPQDNAWLAINGQPVAFRHELTIGEGDEAIITGYVPALLNDERVNILISFDPEHPDGTITGLRRVYAENETETIAKGV